MSEATLRSPGLGRPVRLLSDSALAEKASGGDARAFEEIYRRYHQAVYRYCRSIVGNDHDAMDALQGTMTKALRSIPGGGSEVRLKPWLYRVAHNECIDLIRRRRHHADVEDIDPESTSRTESDAAVRDRLRQVLKDIDHLPERQRSALVMRELNGLGFDEIGDALGTSASVSRQTVYEARVALQDLEVGRNMLCEDVRQEISAGDRRKLRGRAIRAHLRSCAECQAFRRGIGDREHQLQVFVPYLPAAAAASILSGISGIGGSGGTGALVGGGGSGAAAVAGGLGTGAKVVAVLAVTASLGAGVAGIQRGSRADSGSESGTTPAAASEAALHRLSTVGVAAAGTRADRRTGRKQVRSGEASGGSDRNRNDGQDTAGDRPSGGQQGGDPSGGGSTGPVSAAPSGDLNVPAVPNGATVNVPKVKPPGMETPGVDLEVEVPARLPADVPEVVEKVEETVGQVTGEAGKLAPKLP